VPISPGDRQWAAMARATRSSRRKLPRREAWGSTHVILLRPRPATSARTGMTDWRRRSMPEAAWWPGGSLAPRSGGPDPLLDNRALQENPAHGACFCNDGPPDPEAIWWRSHRSRPAGGGRVCGRHRPDHALGPPPPQDAIPSTVRAPVHGHPARSRRILSKGRWRRCCHAAGGQWIASGVAIHSWCRLEVASTAMAGRPEGLGLRHGHRHGRLRPAWIITTGSPRARTSSGLARALLDPPVLRRSGPWRPVHQAGNSP